MADFEPRRGKPDQQIEYADGYGTAHTLKADAEGVIHPKSVDDAAIADLFDLPVARKAIADKAGTTGGKE